MALNYEIDNLDIQILNNLMEDAFIPYTELGKKLFVSAGTIHVRMAKLQKLGIVNSPRLQVDLNKLGMDVTAFIGVYLIRSDMYDKVGNYSLFLKIICRDTQHLRIVLHDRLQKIEGISRTETLISLEESFDRPLQIEVPKEK